MPLAVCITILSLLINYYSHGIALIVIAPCEDEACKTEKLHFVDLVHLEKADRISVIQAFFRTGMEFQK